MATSRPTTSRNLSQPGASYVIGTAFGNDIGALPVIVAIEHHHHAPTFDMAECLFGIARFARQAKPQHVHWRAIVIAFETGFRTHGGMAAVTSDNQIGAYLNSPSGVFAWTPTTRPFSSINPIASVCIRRSNVR